MLGIAERMLAAPDVSSTLRAPPSRGAAAERRTPATPARPESHEHAADAPERLTYTILEAAQRLGVSERLGDTDSPRDVAFPCVHDRRGHVYLGPDRARLNRWASAFVCA